MPIQRHLEQKERNISQISGDYMAKVLKNQAGLVRYPFMFHYIKGHIHGKIKSPTTV